jgi:D-alanyl-D-alanine dipeptidase
MKLEVELQALDEALEILQAYARETLKLEEKIGNIHNAGEILRDHAVSAMKAIERMIQKKEEQLKEWAMESDR